MSERNVSRREMIAALASVAALPLVSACGGYSMPLPPPSTTPDEASARALLDDIAESLLRLPPEGATAPGIDPGASAALRSQLADRSAEGQQRTANRLRTDLARLNAFDASNLSYATRTSFEVVRSADRKSVV